MATDVQTRVVSGSRLQPHMSLWFTAREAFGIALGELRSHKLRSFLTLLGIVISTTTLIVVMAVVNGLNVYVATHVANLGTNTFVLSQMRWTHTSYKDYLEELRHSRRIEPSEFELLRNDLPGYEHMGAAASMTVPEVKYGRQVMEDTQLVGATPGMADIGQTEVAYGRYISASDILHHSLVCFIGHDLVQKLFPGADPIGNEIFVRGIPFRVIGAAKAIGTTFGQSQDNFLHIPLTTYEQMFVTRPNLNIFVQARDASQMGTLEDEARELLRVRRHIPYNEKDTFAINTSEELMETWHELTGSLFASSIGVVAVFMVIGGIVIMNIMLASVTERYHEIGIRKSLGARRRDILMQFLIESIAMAGAGGAVGVILAFVVTFLVRVLFVVASVPVTAVVIGLLLSGTAGLFFGIYPASKAARLDPIEALRREG